MIFGFRRWVVNRDGLLLPTTHLAAPVAWLPGPNTAVCRCLNWTQARRVAALSGQFEFDPERDTDIYKRHTRPLLDSTCGFYAHRDPIRLCRCQQPNDPEHGVVGVIRAVPGSAAVEHTRGWRMWQAELAAVVDFSGRLHRMYRVRRFPTLDDLYDEWAPPPPFQRRIEWAEETEDWCRYPIGGWRGVSRAMQRPAQRVFTPALVNTLAEAQAQLAAAEEAAKALRRASERLSLTIRQGMTRFTDFFVP